MALYARRLTLRNCGRLSVVASDFGADYRTHTHITGEALYASLTRGATRRIHEILLAEETYDFGRDYAVSEMPVWFTPGLFLNHEGGHRLGARDLDSNYFNVVHELYPSTGATYVFDPTTPSLRVTNRPAHVPTYGMWQSILPNRRFATLAFSGNERLLDSYECGQTYLLGKKRTMVQIVELTESTEGREQRGPCQTPFLELPPDGAAHFASFEVATVTMRYIVIRGWTREGAGFWEFAWRSGLTLRLPDFYVDRVLPQSR